MRTLGLALIVLLGAGCRERRDAPPTADAASKRTTSSGEVVGFVGRYGSWAWYGIPYAAPPVGDRRWRAPAPPPTWSGVRETVHAGSPCTQYASPLGGVKTARANTPVGDEDCLYLNVWAPRSSAPSARLPVMVWIHGGGNTIGAGDLYDGGNLAATHDLVVVTVNYRLGPFGWFRHAALRDDAPTDAERSGNFAILDLIRALEWVRDNAVAFGGDPDRVTIFGESAGGTNVYALMLSPLARGLFHRAIVESGTLRRSDAAAAEDLVDDPEPGEENSSGEMLLRLLVHDGTSPDRAAARARARSMSAADVARYLRSKSAREILAMYTPMPGAGMILMPTVVVDGAVLPREDPLESLARADGHNVVPVIIGTNRDENKLFMFNDPTWVRRWLWIVPRLRDPAHYEVTAEYLSKLWQATGADEPATRLREAQPDVFVYRFDWHEEPTVLGADLAVMLGASHGFEIPFVFGHFDLGREADVLFDRTNAPGRASLSAEMMSYWAAFAYDGRPGRGRHGDLPEWGRWEGGTPHFLVLDTPAGGGLRPSGDTVTRAALLASLAADPRVATPAERCAIMRDMVLWAGSVTRAEYAERCPEVPLDVAAR